MTTSNDGRSISVPTRSSIWVDKSTEEGVEGYTFFLDAATVFLTEEVADQLARFILFKPEEPKPAADAVG